MKMKSVILFLVVFVIACVNGRGVPITPCGKLFNYFESETQEIFGAMTFKNDLSGEYHLVVNMSIPTKTDKNISINRRTPEYKVQNGESIEYYVFFPYNHTFPLLTAVEFNGKLYCVGPAANSKDGVTPLSTSDHLSTKIVSALVTEKPVEDKTTFSNRVPDKFKNNCGDIFEANVASLVFKGEPTKDGEFPWLVHLRYYEEKQGTYEFRCAGSLVTSTFVVTAAHCVKEYGHLLSKADFIVVLGKYNIKSWATKSTLRDVVAIYVHPDYVEPSDADLAVMELESPVTYTKAIKPICLWSESEDLNAIVNSKGTIVGWGRDEKGNEVVNEPKKISMPVVAQDVCLRQDDRFSKLTSTRTFCAGNLDGSGPCTGDSGGSFMMLRNSKWVLRGVVSTALRDTKTRTCDTYKYMVFCDVAKYMDWLLPIINK